MNDHHLLLGIILLLALCIAIYAIYLLRMSAGPVTGWSRDWIFAFGIIVALLGGNAWLDERDAKAVAQMEREGRIRELMNAGYLRPDKAWLNVNLNDCPPQIAGMTEQVVMAIATQPDGAHVVQGCSRIAGRQYVVTR